VRMKLHQAMGAQRLADDTRITASDLDP
jgi:hypothetical protein